MKERETERKEKKRKKGKTDRKRRETESEIHLTHSYLILDSCHSWTIYGASVGRLASYSIGLS